MGYNNKNCNSCNHNDTASFDTTGFDTSNYNNSNYNNSNYNNANYSNDTSSSYYCPEQHVHEIVGSTLIEGCCQDAHNHRFATVSEEAIPSGKSHVHKVNFNTDTFDGHYHEFCGTTSTAISVGDGRHVHFLKDTTESADGHTHDFRVATLIDNPIEKHYD